MGVNSRLRDIRPPLPAPTESMDEGGYSGLDTDVATNVTTRTDKTSYEIPEDGSPIVISTDKITGSKESVPSGHQRGKSQTSLLIEYFEGSKTGDRTKSRPSVRVKVTPSSRKKSGSGGPDAVQITGIGKDRKPSYTRRISLGSNKTAEVGLAPLEGTEISQSSGSNISARPPVEIEVLDHNASDLSTRSRNLMYAPNDSNVSSMPPDSMLEGSNFTESERSRGLDRDDDVTVKDGDYLNAPTRERSGRSISRERIAQRVMEKLGQTGSKPKSSKSRSARSLDQEYERSIPITDRQRRSSKNSQYERDTVTGAESSLLSSDVAPSQRSIRSGSDISNNPKLLGMVEDTIKRIILPEINAIKKDQRDDRNYRSFESSRRGSILDDTYERGGLGRSLSKSSSTPNISSKPKVVLNRDGDDPGTVLSRGDSERKKMRQSSRGSYTEERPSSRRSSGKHSSRDDRYDDETVRQKSSRSNHKLRDTAAAGIAGGILTAAALKHHDSQGDDSRRRKKRSKSRGSGSRSASLADYNEEAYTRKEDIPPMPLASHINDSDVTRESIVSTGTEMPPSQDSPGGMRTPVREVSRGSFKDAVSPSSPRTATRTPVSRGGLGMSHSNQSIESPRSARSGHSTKDRIAALGAAGLGGAAFAKGAEDFSHRSVDDDGYGDNPTSQRKISSPVQSISSLKKNFEEDPLVPSDFRPRSAAPRSSAGRLRSNASSPSTEIARSRKQSQNMSGEDTEATLHGPEPGFLREATPGTPVGEDVDDWYERQHQLNNQYRNSLDAEDSNRDSFAATNRDSYQTNPYPQDEKRFTQFTDDSQEYQAVDSPATGEEQGLRRLGANPQYIHTPYGAESAVASLIMEPSTVSSSKLSPRNSPTKGSYSDRMAAHLQDMGKDSPPIYQGSTLSQTMPSQDRWAAIKGQARNMSASPLKAESPRDATGEQRKMSSSAIPLASDPLPEIGHFDDTRSDISTNPSIIQGPLGGDATGKETWPYSPGPEQTRELSERDSQSLRSGHGRTDGMLGAAAAGGAALAAAHAMKQPTVEDEQDVQRRLTPGGGEFIDREATPSSAAGFRDEGYVTDAHARSAGALTPRADQQKPYSKKEMDEFNRAMDEQDLGEDDPFTGNEKHARHISGNSHGMDSPLYDSATGKGMDHIQSKDIVALMDHLTVRDAQRNARDTEILVSLVRSATEMRQSFDEMKRFIVEQDRMIMRNADRGNEQTAQRVLSGPRPQPTSSPRTPRQSTEDIQTKRKGVLQRALKGLTRGKSANDLAKVEDMLMQILDNVEDLKHQGGVSREPLGSYTNDSLDTYERLRNAPDSGYEPEGQAGTSSTPSHSGNLSVTPRAEKQQFHSGYNGRPGSENRVSTVLEGDEDDELEPHERHVLNHQFEDNERFNTPTQESQRQRELAASNASPQGMPGQEIEITPRSTDKQQKHKSNGSSILGIPKVSRWSKTTTSSAAPEYDSPNATRNQRPLSDTSRSQSSLGYDDDKYSLRSQESLGRGRDLAETRSMRSQASRLTRTPSPLIPSEASFKQRDDYYEEGEPSPIQEDFDPQFDDPKYHAHRNSLLLQHPQPRQGATGRHQNTLETQASRFDDGSGTNSDLSQRTVSDFDPATWGSSGTAGLAKHRLSQFEPLSPVSLSSPRDDGPLVPQQQKPAVPPKEPEPEPEEDWEPTYSNSGFSRGGYSYNNYSSPFGSGHLLEPIEEVRYSLETDSGHVSTHPSPSF